MGEEEPGGGQEVESVFVRREVGGQSEAEFRAQLEGAVQVASVPVTTGDSVAASDAATVTEPATLSATHTATASATHTAQVSPREVTPSCSPVPEVADSQAYADGRLREDNRQNGEPSSAGRALVGILALVAVVVLIGSLMYIVSPPDSVVYMILMAASIVAQCCAARLEGYGYLNLGFFICLLVVLMPFSSTPEAAVGEINSFVALAIPVALVSSVIGWVFRGFVYKDVYSNWTRSADVALAVLRVAVIGATVVGLLGVSAGGRTVGDGTVAYELSLFSWSGCLGLCAAIVLHWAIDGLLYGSVLRTVEGEAVYRVWHYLQKQVGVYSSIVQVVSAYFALILCMELRGQAPNISEGICVVVGVVLAAIPIMLVHRLAKVAVRQRELLRVEELENALRGANSKIDSLEKRELNRSREVQKTSGNLELLSTMVRDMGAATTTNEVCGIVVRMFRSLGIPFQSFVLFLMQDGTMFPLYSVTPYSEILDMANLLQLEEPLVVKAFAERRAQMSNNMTSGSVQRIFKDERSVLCVPLIVSQRPIGVIYMGARADSTYSDDLCSSAVMMAACSAPSVHNILMFESKERDLAEERRIRTQVEAQRNQLEGLQNMVQAIARQLRQEHTLKVVVGSIAELIKPAQTIVVFLEKKQPGTGNEDDKEVPLEDREFVPAKAESPYLDQLENIVVHPGKGFMGEVLRTQKRIPVNDFRTYSRDNFLRNELSAIGVPLLAEDELLGGIYVGSSVVNAFGDAEINLIQTAASQAGLAIKNAALMEQARQQALTDGLTGLYTHRFFKMQLKIQVDDASRRQRPACLIMVDADKFKQYNDTLGHPAGDALLQEIAGILTSAVRSNDVVCRQGGDEFSVIMKDCSKENGVATAKSIGAEFVKRFSTHAVHVTASIGVACFPDDADSSFDLHKRADEALYEAKRTGRNRVCVAVRPA